MAHRRLTVAAALAAVIAVPAEGLRQYAYRDPVGILTVCYGATGEGVEAGRWYSLEECKKRLNDDMWAAVVAVDQCHRDLPEPVLAAFSDAVFNMGPTIACDPSRSTAARLLKVGDYKAACDQLPRWNKAKVGGVFITLPGLTKRREAERELCLKGIR